MTLLWLLADAWAVRPTEGGLFAFDAADDVRTYDEPSGRVRVHWAATGPSAAPAEDADGDGVSDYAQDAAEVALEALDRFAANGLRLPLSEADLGLGDLGGSAALDVYLVDFGGAADGNFGVDTCAGAPLHCGGFLAVENDFRGYAYPSPRAGLEVVVPHELFHGVQMAYHGALDVWAAEGSAVWAERLFDPASTDFLRFADAYLEEPTRSIDEPPGGPVPSFAYGTGLWFDFLTLRHDNRLMAEILEAWEASPDEQTSPMLAALEARGDATSEAWRAFSSWNLATGERAGAAESYPYAADLAAPAPEATGGLLDDDNRFYPLATTYYRLNHPGGELALGLEEPAPGVYFSVHPTTDGTRDAPVEASVAEAWGDEPGPVSLGELPAGQYWIWGSQPAAAEDSVKVRFCAGTEAEVDACFAAAGTTAPTATPPADEPTKGCGCAGAPTPGGALPLLLALAMIGCTGRSSTDRPRDGDPDTGAAPVPTSDADLVRLDVGAPLTPPFHPAVRNYVVRASDLRDPFDVVAEPASADASVAVRLETIEAAPAEEGTTLSRLADHRVRIDVVGPDGEARTYAVNLLPDDFPDLAVTVSGEASPGWILLGSFTFKVGPDGVADYLMALDERGTPGWWRRADGTTYDLRVSRDDHLTWIEPGRPNHAVVLGPGYVPVDPPATAEEPGFTDVALDVHEYDRLADGGSLAILNAFRDEDLSALGGDEDQRVQHQVVQQLAADGTVRFSWSTVDLLPYDQLPAEILSGIVPGEEWEPFHVNSAELDPFDGHLLVSVRHASQVVKVATHDAVVGDRAVSAGDVLWRLGGPGSDFAFVGDERRRGEGFAGQHSARATGPDTVAVFDNSLSYDYNGVGAARYVEYALDPLARTATPIREHALPGDLASITAGSVQPLADGSIVIGWGQVDDLPVDVTELDPDGRVVLEIGLPGILQSYRAWKVGGDPLTGTWTNLYRP